MISLFFHLYIHVNLSECQEGLSKMTASQLCLNTITDFSLTCKKSITQHDTQNPSWFGPYPFLWVYLLLFLSLFLATEVPGMAILLRCLFLYTHSSLPGRLSSLSFAWIWNQTDLSFKLNSSTYPVYIAGVIEWMFVSLPRTAYKKIFIGWGPNSQCDGIWRCGAFCR